MGAQEYFYIRGSVYQLCRLCTRSFSGDLKKVLDRVLNFLLGHQCVEARALPGRLWLCELGSGMGLKHSGDVADLSLYEELETWSTAESVLRENEIDGYWRFRDDILLLAGNRSKSVPYARQLVERGGIFKLKCEGFYESTVHFLDVRITRTNTMFEFGPEFKPTSLQIPLSQCSAHPGHVHSSWPTGQLRRFERISSSRK